ncbi:hypothetical protein ACIRNI_07095 [Streptomyces sp. NPDC093546]
MTTITYVQDVPGRLGNALRAIRVFAAAAFEIVLLGAYAEGAEAAGVRRR